MNHNKCINEYSRCIGREKFPINGKIICCKVHIEDELFIAQSVIDAIDDCSATKFSIERVCSRISFASDAISIHKDDDREVLHEFKRFALLIYEHRKRIIDEKEHLDLVCSFVNVVKNWFNYSFLNNSCRDTILNTLDSIKADLSTLEMALGVCLFIPSYPENLDDIFF
ncbi:MAG: hypothetical protein PHW64_09330 [Sulfuricurvum sp.]|nr:hypothetical protein [Sulfuricurvum sp.]